MMEKQIQIAVARADIIICAIARNWPLFAVSLIIGFIVGRWLYRCLGR